MRVCMMIEGQEDVTWDQWLALALACEEHGPDGLFRSDHYAPIGSGPDSGSLDAWAVLTALAARTERIRLGTLVSPVTFRHPSVLAKMPVTADHVSGGRSEDEFSFQGQHYVLEGCRALPKPVQRPHPPVIVGGSAGPATARLAARWADEYNTVSAPAEECARRRRVVAEAWERADRDPATLRFSLMTGCIVGTDRDEVLDRARRVQEHRRSADDPADLLRATAAEWITGTVEEVVTRLQTLEAAGVDRVMLQHLAHDDVDMVALVGR